MLCLEQGRFQSPVFLFLTYCAQSLGRIPRQLGQLVHLSDLRLDINKITGTVR